MAALNVGNDENREEEREEEEEDDGTERKSFRGGGVEKAGGYVPAKAWGFEFGFRGLIGGSHDTKRGKGRDGRAHELTWLLEAGSLDSILWGGFVFLAIDFCSCRDKGSFVGS